MSFSERFLYCKSVSGRPGLGDKMDSTSATRHVFNDDFLKTLNNTFKPIAKQRLAGTETNYFAQARPTLRKISARSKEEDISKYQSLILIPGYNKFRSEREDRISKP